MLGIKFAKFLPTTYVLVYKNGAVVREGTGLSFFYYSPTTSLVGVPTGSNDVPFIFEEQTSDFQSITVQGQVTFRIAEPKKIAQLLNFTLAPNGRTYVSDDPSIYHSRVINLVKVIIRKKLQTIPLKESIKATELLMRFTSDEIKTYEEVKTLGLEILGLSILAIKPTPETSRALEAEAREKILKEADDAIYERRNSAIERERIIKENELDTEIAVENKNKQIREAKMDAEQVIQKRKYELMDNELKNKIVLEQRNKDLVLLTVENAKKEADAKAYAMTVSMKALENADKNLIQALAGSGMQPAQLIAMAFQELASKAENIGQLNITPDLLREIMNKPK
jgi:regulator of protease activity HflC (stomatin/prohibitin superfamily)